VKEPRLDFVLPMFLRVAWVSDQARGIWEPRFAEIARSWREIEWRTVVDGVRRCAILSLSHDELTGLAPVLEHEGVRAVPLSSSLRQSDGRNVLVYRVVIGRSREMPRFRKAWMRGDDETIGQCLGYPECCRAFFRRLVVDAAWLDPTWPAASGAARSGEPDRRPDLSVIPELNPFWWPLGIRLVPHIPCSYKCEAARSLAERFLDSGRNAGFADHLDHTAEIVRWPVEWSALHGIAEIKTPVLKMTTRTDATPDKLTLRYKGERYPREGARGSRFPYDIQLTCVDTAVNGSPRE
jgi:hypothetical protein